MKLSTEVKIKQTLDCVKEIKKVSISNSIFEKIKERLANEQRNNLT